VPSPDTASKQASADERPRDGFVQSLARGFAVLRAFNGDRATLTIADVARICGLTRAGARRILLTLAGLGYLRVERRRHFYLTARTLELGQGFRPQPIWEAARPILRKIAYQLNETVSTGVLRGSEVIYTARIRSSRVLQWDLNVGDRLPAYACSMGRVLLAALPAEALAKYLSETTLRPFTRFTVTDPEALRGRLDEALRQGWSCVRGEIEESITALAVPLVDGSGSTIAALEVQLSTERATPQLVSNSIVPSLLDASHTISGIL
jgi:IclR family transcriptional regulator, pca regulon regulatory protein